MLLIALGVSLGILLGWQPAFAASPSWSAWEERNSVARSGDWRVIKQEGEDFCYLKQSYENRPDLMEILVKDSGTPFIVTPFVDGMKRHVEFHVDEDAARQINNASETRIPLPVALVPELKKGHTLSVTVTPVGRSESHTQGFSLRGFSAAYKQLSSEICQPNTEEAAENYPIQISVERNAAGGVRVGGTTTLPDGMEFMITFNNGGQSKATVRDGILVMDAVGGFTDRGTPVPPGKYRIEIDSPIIDLQPRSIRHLVPKERIDFTVIRTVK